MRPTTADGGELRELLGKPMQLLEQAIVLENGEPYGVAWQPWQADDFRAIFATLPDGRPAHRLVYIERRRGESKTDDVGATATTDLITGPRGHRSYAVAGDVDQAALIIDSIQGFRDRSALLGAVLEVNRSTVRNRYSGDELSLQPDDHLWLPMWSAIGKRRDAQMVCASMAGADFASVAWKVREMARTTPGYYFATRQGTEPAPWLSAEMMAEQEATLHPSDYARFWLCEWREVSGSWLSREAFDACVTGAESLAGNPRYPCRGYVDVGILHDPTVLCVGHDEGDARNPRIVADTLQTLQGSRSAPVQMEVVEDLVAELTATFGVREWCFESPQAVASVQRLQRRLPSVKVWARYPTADSMGALYGTLYRLVTNQQIILYPHEQLRREALSLAVKTSGGRMKVVESSSVHQDHVVATGGAATLLLAAQRTAVDFDASSLSGLGRHRNAAKATGAEYSQTPQTPDSTGLTAPSLWRDVP